MLSTQVLNHDRHHGQIEAMGGNLNEDQEDLEKSKKNKQKTRREGGLPQSQNYLKCTEAGWCFVGQTKAGLVNHVRQAHSATAQSASCAHCSQNL